MSSIDHDSQINSPACAQTPVAVEANSQIDAFIGIRWQGVDCLFSDWRYLQNIHLGRDYLPLDIEDKLPGARCGDEIHQHFGAGELTEAYSNSQIHRIKRAQFQPTANGRSSNEPRQGRFYPKDFFQNIDGIYEGNKFPCRIMQIDEDVITLDMNHPLAAKPIELMIRIEAIHAASAERGGRCNDIPALVCDLGPGLQDSLPDQQCDFFSGSAFTRLDPGDDSEFFKLPDLQPFWDSTASQQVSQLYQKLIPHGADVLDLMAGVHSPLQEADIAVKSVTCAGLNQTELNHNPLCGQRIVLDVNATEALPFDNAQFDVVLIHAAIEYVIRPAWLFAEISRVLKPGGRVIITFSNRFVMQKVIQLWRDVQEFERPGIILTYLRNAGFGAFNSFSMRGLARPKDDRLADRLQLSDPVYAVWADKR